MNRFWIAVAVSAAALLWGHSVFAQDGVTAAMAFYSLDNIVLLFSAILVLFMILTAIDAIESKDSGEIETLEMLTQDRSAMMTKIRHNYFESEQDLSTGDRNFVLDITILFENAVHTLARYGHLLRSTLKAG